DWSVTGVQTCALPISTAAPLAVPLIPFGQTSRPSASMMYVPIHFAGRVLGILSVQSYRTEAYRDPDLSLLQNLADHCGAALRRKIGRASCRERGDVSE